MMKKNPATTGGFEPAISCMQVEHAIHYTIDIDRWNYNVIEQCLNYFTMAEL